MQKSHPIRCACGQLSGALDGAAWVNRVICYCADCQAFAEQLGHEDDILDPRGGSDIVQTGPRYVTFTRGREQLACLRLTPKGPLRWYATCCGTPIGNTPANPKLSFVGLLHNCLGDTRSLDVAFGPPRMHVFTKFARGEPKPRQQVSLPAIAGFVSRMALARLNGGYRRTPFFLASGEPVTAPRIIKRKA